MGILDFLKPKSKSCQLCKRDFPKLHKYNPIYFEGRETRRSKFYIPRLLCNDCFLKQFKEDLVNYKSKIVFIEPIVSEGYSFTKFKDDEVRIKQSYSANLKTFIPPNDAICNLCSQPARFTWVTGDILIGSPEHGEPFQFKSKDECSQFNYLCSEHLQDVFSESIKKHNFYFMEFWPFKGFGEGYCS